MGVWTSGSETTIRNLAVDRYYIGIRVGPLTGFLVENNTTTNTGYAGLNIRHAYSGTVKGNTVFSGPKAGVGILVDHTNNNTIDSNKVLTPEYNFKYGLLLAGSARCIVSNNAIDGPTLINSYTGGGPCCSNNEIFQNTFYNFSIWWSQDNIIYNNNFLGDINTYESTGTVYNLTPDIGGNYWIRFDSPEEGCVDANADGYCDSPFYFTDGVDYYPLTRPYKALPETPEEAAELLEGLVAEGTIDATVAESLVPKLETAITAKTPGAALGSLGAFINQVKAQAGKKIDPETAAELISIAEALMAGQ
jgi:parallel beta-helix repeat protein